MHACVCVCVCTKVKLQLISHMKHNEVFTQFQAMNETHVHISFDLTYTQRTHICAPAEPQRTEKDFIDTSVLEPQKVCG